MVPAKRFVVKSDPTGHITQSVKIADFYPQQACEATDSTVWVLGYEMTYRYDPNCRDVSDEEKNVLRHYSSRRVCSGVSFRLARSLNRET